MGQTLAIAALALFVSTGTSRATIEVQGDNAFKTKVADTIADPAVGTTTIRKR
jgi:hypothetical protein